MKKKRKSARRTHPTAESSSATYACPSCFEAVDTFPDPGGGEDQTYVEDCSLCCRPNVLHVRWDEGDGSWSIEASRES
jgi:hypothetical protein